MNSYSDRHLAVKAVNLTTVDSNVILVALQPIVVHRVGIYLNQLGTSGIVTVTFQKTVAGNDGTDTTIKAIVVDEVDDAIKGSIIYGEPTAPVVLLPGHHVNLEVAAESSGTASTDAYALVEFSLLDAAPSDNTTYLIATD